MLSWRLQTGPEQAELRELNARLHDYVCRVRELERENLLLEEELRGRRGQEGLWAEEQSRFSEEARRLRQQLDELGWATALAEGERDALRRELWELQRLGEETRAARDRLDAELGAQRRELQETLGARADLEARLGRLQAERRLLDEAHDRDVRELRARAAGLTLHYRARAPGPAAPPPRLREVRDSFALLVAESRRDAVQMYEDEVRELEEALRRGQESRREAEEEMRLCAQEAEALRREALELEQLRALLEDELQRMREAYDLQAEERQGVIACLENEKASLTLAMADRLRDYQDLVQMKTGLSLEVATYRALLEGESNPKILILNERLEKIPQDFRNTCYHYTTSALQRENERNLFLRQKAPSWSSSHGLSLHSGLPPRPWPCTAVGGAARRGLRGSSYSSFANTRWENGYETSLRTFPAAPSHGKHTEAQVKTFPGRPKANGIKDVPTRLAPESTVTQESRRERWDSVATGASESTRSNERTIILGKKIDVKPTKEKENSRAGTVQTKRPEKMFDSKERASEERNLRWEELTKLDKEARERESQQMKEKEKEKELLKKKSARDRDVPISVEVVKDGTPGASPKGFQTPPRTAAGLGLSGGVGTRETRFRPHSGDTTSSPTGDAVPETIAENIVSSVLKHFAKSPDKEATADSFPDTKVTFVDRKEIPGDGKTKTEIVVESKLIEEVDASDEAGLDYLLREEVKDVELKGKSAEQMIGDIINLGLKGREGRAKVVNVEIIEEPVSYVGSEKTQEFSTPFKVEEVDDVSPGSRGLAEEEKGFGKTYVTFSGSQHEKTRRPQENVTHVEEVTEAGDSEGEQSYFVSTPEEYAGGHDRDGGPVYGQVHVEEESTIRYSWQDEIMPGTRRRMKRDKALGETVVKPADIGEPSVEAGVGSTHWKEQARSGVLHAEPIVIEKEIKIARGFHPARKGGHTEPRQQVVEVIGQLEENLPERMKTELSALSGEGQGGPGSVSVDVKKVQPPGGGSLTLVAEVNLSQTVDADQLDLEKLSKDEAGEIEKAVESVVRGSLAKRHSTAPGSPETEEQVPAAGLLFKRWATQELYTPTHEEGAAGRAPHSPERVTSQGPVSATMEVTGPQGFGRSLVLEDVSKAVRRIKVGPTGTWRTEQVSLEGPTAEVVQMDVSNVEASPRWTRETTGLFSAGAGVQARTGSDPGAWRDTGRGSDWAAGGGFQAAAGDRHKVPGEEGREFNKTVQLQRMVDTRSVISDEKKVALLYLDSQEEEAENEGHWF
ncbi:synemin isoform X2 [Talpa occidentalis]|uniref:synemin isoform X2 n=1 Tax=Talpa occidentalis TaxID=50954 RepID=UPI00188FABC7|nr:synemin isoform X2 [Talpa occidentalis]